MFGKGTDASGGDCHGHSIFQQGIVVQGEIEAKGEVRFDGRLEGKIRVTGRLTIGSGGILRADVEASEVVVMGRVEGKIRALRRLELLKGARVEGDVATPVLVVEEGVVFQGNSNMQQGEVDSSPDEDEAITEDDAGREASEYKTVYH